MIKSLNSILEQMDGEAPRLLQKKTSEAEATNESVQPCFQVVERNPAAGGDLDGEIIDGDIDGDILTGDIDGTTMGMIDESIPEE